MKITQAALWLDTWLQEHLGRPYNALLGIGLVTEIVRQSVGLTAKISSVHAIAGQVLPILLEFALLVHQIGALSHRFENRSREQDSAPPRRGR
jgi:hypothetical protein